MAAALVAGEDAAQVAEARARLAEGWAGPGAEAEMRLDRLAAAEVRRDGALLLDALKARGFFPGPRVVLLDDATDGLAPAVAAALAAWAEGDAHLVATGTGLAARGALRRLFEGERRAVAIALYDDPPDAEEVEAMLREAGLRPDGEAREALMAASRTLAPAEFRGLLRTLALHEIGGESPLGAGTVAALMPGAAGAEIDEALLAVAEGQSDRVPLLVMRLAAQGATPVGVAVALGRMWRAALLVQATPGGPEAGLQALRPPAGGLRRQAIRRAAGWRRERVEEALRLTLELDLGLRGGSEAPAWALLERALLRQAALRGGG